MNNDNPESLGILDRKEIALLVVSISIAIVLITYSAAIIIAVMNTGDEITIKGEIDLAQFQNTVFIIVGAGILYLGITQGGKIASLGKPQPNSKTDTSGELSIDDVPPEVPPGKN